jgi:hypothetical protein
MKWWLSKESTEYCVRSIKSVLGMIILSKEQLHTSNNIHNGLSSIIIRIPIANMDKIVMTPVGVKYL